ncbi:ester cyclase [Sulfitobacter albidus]|uniref:Ester cyclase n=1 Tax=Sulfitobacter albidus TaxID=2829501 RepID=A0A975JG05_9RHOB|nr:ester cyclase [Sulfitobacter albidus]QUJ77622.1 ester cyclase [Sulfitobacter albidus]
MRDRIDAIAEAKTLVQAHYAALARATPDTVADTLAARMGDGAIWRGFHPFNLQTGPQAAAEVFWTPLLNAFSAVQRREDVFFAAHNHNDPDQDIWVVSMGHLMGLFDAPFVGIRPTRKIAMLRYAEFNRVVDGQIVETAMYCDLLHLMRQAGVVRFPDQTAAHLVQPGPRTHDGLLFGASDPAEGARTLAIIDSMVKAIDAANANPTALTPREEMQRNWHDDMLWWGPEGIGATYTIDRYIEQHQTPFRSGLSGRTFNGHVARLAEGNYGGFFGWPNLTLSVTGGFMGLPVTETRADMRVIDIYRRDGDKLAENWIFIDMLHFLLMQGIDVLGELA